METPETNPRNPLSSLVSALAQLRNERTMSELARELQVSAEALQRWVSSLEIPQSKLDSFVTEEPAPAEDDELRRLRLENAYLRQQRDLYRKACGVINSPTRSRP